MAALRQFASAAAAELYSALGQARSPDELDSLSRHLWRAYGEGSIGDDDAQILDSYIANRRPMGRRSPNGHLRALDGYRTGIREIAVRVGTRFPPRQRPRSPNLKESRERRRRLGGSGALPAVLRHHYTEGQRAVLTIIAGEIKHHGICDLCIDKIAALAGVCRTTVQTTLHQAWRVHHHIQVQERPQPGFKHLTHLIKIQSREWLNWISRGHMAHRPLGSNSPSQSNLVSTTKSIGNKKAGNRSKRAASQPETEDQSKNLNAELTTPEQLRVLLRLKNDTGGQSVPYR